MKSYNRIALLASCSFCSLLSANAEAQVAASPPSTTPAPAAVASDDGSGLREIIVTAQKRGENLQKVPVAVTAFSSESLRQGGVTNVQQIANLTPSLALPQGSGGIVTPFLRGVGNTANAVGNESSVAMYVDGVYYTRLTAGFFDLANVDRVEVLKGPQGTLFGRNSSGGVIQIVTANPSHTFQVRGQVGYGNYDTVQGNFYATGGLTDTLAADVSIAGRKQSQGYGYNATRHESINGYDDFIVRSKLLWEPTSSTKAVLTGFYGYTHGPVQGSTFPGTTQGYVIPPYGRQPSLGYYDQDNELDTYVKSQSWGGTLKIDQDLGFAQLSSISALVVEKEHQVIDGDYGPSPDYRADLWPTVNEKSQEFQLSSNRGSMLTWIVGLYYYNTQSIYNPLAFQGPAFFGPSGNLGPAFGTDVLGDNISNQLIIKGQQRATSYAGYAQATYEILPKLKLTGGIRYTIDKLKGSGTTTISVNNGAVVIPVPNASGQLVTAGNTTDKRPTFKAAINYEFTGNTMGYFSFSRGYKSGAYNLLPFSPSAQKPEILDAYEVGLKNELFDRHLRLNLAVFQYNIKNPQVQLLNNGSVVLSNAQSARVRGAEAEGELALTRHLKINFGATYLDSIYTAYTGAPTGGTPLTTSPYGAASPLGSVDASGNRTPLASKFTASIGPQYTLETSSGTWTLNANWNHRSGWYFEPDNVLFQTGINLIDARLSYKPNSAMTFSVWGRNLLGEKYAQFAGTQQGPAGYPYLAAEPRTYGVTAGFSF